MLVLLISSGIRGNVEEEEEAGILRLLKGWQRGTFLPKEVKCQFVTTSR